MAEDTLGYVKNYGVSNAELRLQVAKWINDLFMTYAKSKGKKRWAEKTPDHSLNIPFLAELFPEAFFIHIVRDGRDVACSTAILSDERKAMCEWHSKNILLDENAVVENTLQNAALRWKTWSLKIERSISSLNAITLRYEDLIISTERELRRLMGFIGEKYEPSMLSYNRVKHDFPEWEWGSRDVKRLPSITNRSLERWKRQLSPELILMNS